MKAQLFAFFLTLLSVPALAAEVPDACRYLKDVENKDCAGLDEAALAALDTAAQKRKADVAAVYEALKKNAYLEGVKDDKNTSKSSVAGTLIVLNPVEPPLNERTIPAWFPNDPKVLDVYRRWIVGVNDALRIAKGDTENPVTAERLREIDALLANNKVTLERMKGLKSADQFRCFVGDSCGSRGGVEGGPSGAAVFTAQSGAAKDFAVGADNRPYRLPIAQPGGSLDKGTPVPDTSAAAPGEGSTSKRVVAAATAAGALMLATGAAWWKKRQDDGQWADAQKEVVAQEPKAAPPPKPIDVEAAPVVLHGYVPQPLEQTVINDVLKGADRSNPAAIVRFITARTKFGAYGYDEGVLAAEAVSTMVSNGQIVFASK